MSKRSESKPRTKPNTPVTVAYLAKNFTGKGNLLDLSEEGLKIQGSHVVHAGLQLALQITAPDSAIVIHVSCAHVRWSNGKEFGVKFEALEPAVKAQLLGFLAALSAPQAAQKPL